MAGLQNRKPVAEMASFKLKQLMWDKLAMQQTVHTIWGRPQLDEDEATSILRGSGAFKEMEEGFKAKAARHMVKTLTKEEPQSFLPLGVRQRMEMILHRVRSADPRSKLARAEEVIETISQCSDAVMDETLLVELLANYPESEVKGKLGEYRNGSFEQLAALHPADQLVVRLMSVSFLKAKVQGLLLKVQWVESLGPIQDGCRAIRDGSDALLHAENFGRLLSIILIMGNFMNARGFQGAAYGFRVSSINKLVDTKAQDGTTLLHFIQRTISTHFPEVEDFLKELEPPAAACRGEFHFPNHSRH